MTDPEDEAAPSGPDDGVDALAAEYVLRLLPAAEEADARRREMADPDFAARVAHWRGTFSPLDVHFAAASPSPRLWSRIDRQLFAAEPQAETTRPGLGRWRRLALAAALSAAIALGFAVSRSLSPTASDEPLVVALAPVEGETEFLALIEREAGILRLNRLAGAPGPGRAFELWLVEGEGSVISLGVLPDTTAPRLTLAPDLASRLQPGVTLAISVEPEGGSPTGTPTGPVVAAGEANAV